MPLLSVLNMRWASKVTLWRKMPKTFLNTIENEHTDWEVATCSFTPSLIGKILTPCLNVGI